MGTEDSEECAVQTTALPSAPPCPGPSVQFCLNALDKQIDVPVAVRQAMGQDTPTGSVLQALNNEKNSEQPLGATFLRFQVQV